MEHEERRPADFFGNRLGQQARGVYPVAAILGQQVNPQYIGKMRVADDARLRLERGTLDFALMLRPVPQDAYHSVDLSDDEELVVLLREDDPLSQHESLTVSELKGRKLILPSREAVRSELSAFYEDEVFSSRAQLSNLSANAALMVQQGAGLAVVCKDDYSYTGVPEITVRPLSPAIFLGTALVWKRGGVRSKAARAFIDFLHAHPAS